MEPTVQAPTPPLYSARAIRAFSFLFSPVAGAVLLAQNFKAVGRPDAARKTVWVTIAAMLFVVIILASLPEGRGSSSSLSIGLGIGGGLALTTYSDKIILNKDDFPTKRIRKPLLICLLIFVPLITLLLYPAFNQ